MKQFTVKEFIKYNGPCFACGNTINFRVGTANYNGTAVATLRPTFKPDHFSIDLDVKYSRTLPLWVFYKTNKIVTSDLKEFSAFIGSHTLFLKSYCDRCYCSIESHALEFDLDNMFIKPVGVARESLNVEDDKHIYNIETIDIDPVTTTKVIITALDKKATAPPAILDLPLLPIWKFQTKERLIQKIKTYLTFS